MALPSNALSKSYGSTVNHVIAGAQLADAAFSANSDIDNAFSNSDGYPFVDVVVTLTKALLDRDWETVEP